MTTTSSIPVFVAGSSLTTITLLSLLVFILLGTLVNVLYQLCSRKEVNKPPLVFHYFPIIGSTITYGKDPLAFFQDCKAKYGNVFTFVLLGRPVTVYLGASGNNFILNGKQSELSAEEVYSPLTTPVFGTDVIFDCDNAKFMQQKKFVKFGLSQAALESYVQLIARETTAFFTSYTPLQSQGKEFDVKARIVDVPSAMAELTIYTASSSLQGAEVRRQFSSSGSRIADLYHDLDMGFSPINFFLPSWFPLPRNRKRDAAQREMTKIYTDIISERRRLTNNTCDSDDGKEETEKQDMIWNLMSNCTYKNGNVLPDKEIAHMMIALLLGGHHSSSAVIAFAILSLANRPDIQEKLYEEQVRELGDAGLTYEGLQRLKLHTNVIKETLRLYNPIHSIMRLAKTPLIVKDESGMVVPSGHTLLASPAFSARDETYFADPLTWDPHRWEKKASIHETSDDDELSAKGANSPYLPFGGGRHRCIGEKFAYVQLGVILAIFTRFFQVREMHGNTDALLATDYSSLFSRPLAPAKVFWEPRDGFPTSEISETCMSRSNKDFMSWIRGYVRNYAFFHVFLVTACIFLSWWIKNGANDESGIFAELRQFRGEKCVSLPHTDSIFVIMKTGTTVLHKRLPVHLESTFKCIPDYIVYSDASESVHGLDIHDILSQIDAEIKDQFPTEFALYNRLHGQESSTLTTNQGWKLDKWKFLPMMKSALGARPNAMWFIFIEDDTAVVWSNLLHWLATHDPSEFYYFGRRQEVANRPFAHGGSGFILSNPALRKAVMYLMPRMNQYFNLTMQMSYGDISTGWMLEDSGVSLIDTWPSFQGENPGKLQYTEQIWCRPVMTHHHMSPRDIASLWMLEQRTLLDRRDVEIGASLLHRDVFKALIRPKLVPQLENWDNGRGDERFAQTVSECQDLCISDETCVQFRFTPETCRLSSYVRLGIPTEPRFEITSGWLPDRIDRLYGKFQCRE